MKPIILLLMLMIFAILVMMSGCNAQNKELKIIRKEVLILTSPIVLNYERGDLIDSCIIDLAPTFKGDAAIVLMVPEKWDSIVWPVHHCTFYSNGTRDSLMQVPWFKYEIITKSK